MDLVKGFNSAFSFLTHHISNLTINVTHISIVQHVKDVAGILLLAYFWDVIIKLVNNFVIMHCELCTVSAALL